MPFRHCREGICNCKLPRRKTRRKPKARKAAKPRARKR